MRLRSQLSYANLTVTFARVPRAERPTLTPPPRSMTGNFRTQVKGPKSSVPRRRCWLAIAATATFAMFGLSGPNAEAQPQAGQVSFSTASLYPNFSPTVHDYVVRCHDAGVTVTASAQAGWEASINGHAFRSGTFSEPVPLGSGKAFTVTFREDGGTKLYHYYTRCLPDDFPAYTFTSLAPSSSPKFFTDRSVGKAAPFRRGLRHQRGAGLVGPRRRLLHEDAPERQPAALRQRHLGYSPPERQQHDSGPERRRNERKSARPAIPNR